MDQERISAAQAGDPAALDELLREVQPRILRFGMRMCRHPEDAEDTLQETMVVLATKLKEFRGESSLSTWAYAIARNECMKRQKRAHREFSVGSPEHLPAVPHHQADHIAEVEARDEWGALSTALSSLAPEYREMIVLRDIEGLTAEEVSQVTELSIPAAKSRLHRARKALRLAIAPIQRKPECPDILEAFSRNLEQELSAEVCREMQTHLDECPACTGLCNSLKQNLRLCQLAPAAEIPAKLSEQIRQQMLKVL